MIEFLAATRSNDIRFFVHKRLFKAATGFIGGGPGGAIGGFLSKDQQKQSGRALKLATADRSNIDFRLKQISRGQNVRANVANLRGRGVAGEGRFGTALALLGDGGGCIVPGMRRDPRTGDCRFFLGDQSGRDDQPIGDAVMGRYGAAEVPGSRVIDRAICRRGMVLGDDGFCYNKSQIKNADRQWPRGRRPLLTGGDMRAISIAATAGRRLERTTKRLQKIGLMKKPASRRSIAAQHHAK